MTELPGERAFRGARAYQAGRAAEASVARHYARRGLTLLHERWRGKGGEIDLILADGNRIVFVEVKQSSCLQTAAMMLQPRQIARLLTSAEQFLADQPCGTLTDVRLDVALVDGAGRIDIIENALAHS